MSDTQHWYCWTSGTAIERISAETARKAAAEYACRRRLSYAITIHVIPAPEVRDFQIGIA